VAVECIEVLIKVSLNTMASFPQQSWRNRCQEWLGNGLNSKELKLEERNNPGQCDPFIGGIPHNILLGI